ncbi:hypothetical protein BDQ94DRAFT_149071 [Aspergillus welwitschiae]|uniref:Uncharacterized protein n=1 Tax=Aspergillus welwitschiae TaxID=1341132 RepID=A0A3F3PT91_9EURO|nr:hypothetical protein BDQ94DRAFT_149071 [Aspergillus welwitschiae]RDH30134.1 hypothetical protein BDQ94DRAFT_149071 [Aspergillus welwitschiae]
MPFPGCFLALYESSAVLFTLLSQVPRRKLPSFKSLPFSKILVTQTKVIHGLAPVSIVDTIWIGPVIVCFIAGNSLSMVLRLKVISNPFSGAS